MSRPLNKDVSETEAPKDDERPGRIEFDSRGNSVWRWARDVLDSTSIMLKRLENKDLVLESTHKVPVVGKPDEAQRSPPAKSARGRELDSEDTPRDSGGFDPYNSR